MDKKFKILVFTILVIMTLLLVGCGDGIETYVADGNVERVKQVLEKDPGILKTKTSEFGSLLHLAAFHGRDKCVRLLVAQGLNPDIVQYRFRWRPIHLAIKGGHFSTVRLLVSLGASVKKISTEDTPPICLAAGEGRLGMLRFFLDAGAGLDEIDPLGYIALHPAAAKGSSVIVAFLVERGVDVNHKSHWKFTPLHLAAKEGHLDICKFLLANGALVDPLSKSQYSPMLQAASYGHREIVEYLVEQGANVRATSKDGFNLLHLAALKSNLRLLEFALNHGLSPSSVDNNGDTALHFCAIRNNIEGARILLAAGVNPNLVDKHGYTPMRWARTSGRREIIELMTSLHRAAGEGNAVEANRLASTYPSLINCQDGNGWLPLHHAAKAGSREVAEILIQAGSERGRQAPFESIPILRGSVARLMIPFDMRVYSRPYGKTAADIAEQYNYKDLAAFLARRPAAVVF